MNKKKLLKIILLAAGSAFILLAAAVLALRLMFPPEKIKQMAQDYAKNNLQREISFDRVSFNLIGVTLNNFALSEPSTFQNGTFIKAGQIKAKVAFWPLLAKKIKISTVRINGLEVNIVQHKDGTYNFDSLLTPAGQESPAADASSSGEASFGLTAKHLIVSNCALYYTDEQTGMTAGVDKFNLKVDDFDLANPFFAQVNFTSNFQQENGPAVAVPVVVDLTVYLANMDWAKAYTTFDKAAASYKTVQLTLGGKITNFLAPQATLSGQLTGVTHALFTDFLPDLPHFTLPPVQINLEAQADLEHSSAQIHQARIQVQDSRLSVSGPVRWEGDQPAYKLQANLDIDLAQAVQMADDFDFRPTGTIKGTIQATEKNDMQDIRGTVNLQSVSLLYEPLTFSNMNGTVKIASLNDISCENFTGLLNGEKFTSFLSYKNIRSIPNLVFNAELDKLVLTRFFEDPQNTAPDAAAPAQQTAPQDAAAEAETYFNLKSNIKIGGIEVPYLRADGLALQADLTELSSSMNKTDGTVSFTLQPGAITDIDTFVKGSKVARILLLPLRIINSVAKKLNISLFDATSSASKGEIALTSGKGEYTFQNGIMTINSTEFLSKLTDIKGSGTVNFPTGELDMKVSATVLSKQTPMIIKIGGTLDNPSGKLDVLNTVGSVVGGLLNYKTATGLAGGTAKTAGGVATGAVKTTGQAAGAVAKTGAAAAKETAHAAKATVKAIGGLFKKNTKTDPEAPEEE